MSDVTQLARELVRLGTRCVFGIPGEGTSLELVDEVQRLGASFHLVSHEAAGALMAGGYGRVTGNPGVSLSIKGPGFSNMLGGIAANWLDRNPVLSLSESYGPGSPTGRMHKRMAHGEIVRPIVKAYADNPSPEILPRLWDLCLAEEPGPVHIDVSSRMDRASFDAFVEKTNRTLYSPSEAIKRISDAHAPVVIAGALANRRSWRYGLASLKIPVFTTVEAKGAVDETLSHAAGVFTNAGRELTPEYKILPIADLIVGLGLRTTEIIDIKPLPVPLVALDELPGRAKALNPVTEAICGPKMFSEVIDILETKHWGTAELAVAKCLMQKKLDSSRWLPAACFRVAQQELPESTRFILDTGSFCTIGEHALAARHPLHVMGSALGRSMGISLATGIGACLANSAAPMVIALGDGGVRVYPDAITLAVQQKLPVLVLFMNDGSFASVRRSAAKYSFAGENLHLDSSCWRGVFQAFGCPAERVESLAGLENALSAWKLTTGPLFLDLGFDSNAYLSMTEDIR